MIMVWYDLEMVSFHEMANYCWYTQKPATTSTPRCRVRGGGGGGGEDSFVKVGIVCHLAQGCTYKSQILVLIRCSGLNTTRYLLGLPESLRCNKTVVMSV